MWATAAREYILNKIPGHIANYLPEQIWELAWTNATYDQRE